MFSWLANAWKVPELRRRLLFTAMVLALYRLGSWIPAPGVDSDAIDQYLSSTGGIFNLLNLFSGGALSQFSVFALGIMPYVTASIILQLLTVVIPRLSELQKEGEAGTAKINQYTRYLTVVLSAAQALGYAFLFKNQGILQANAGRLVLIVVTLTVGSVLLMLPQLHAAQARIADTANRELMRRMMARAARLSSVALGRSPECDSMEPRLM